MVAAAGFALAAAVSLSQAQSAPAASSAASASLDYEYFKTKVQPVFLTKRTGHTRCVVCHTTNNAPFHLVPLTPGSAAWNEQQSRQNFTLIQRVAIPGSMDSPIVKHPLAEQAGGDPHHGGAQQFESQADPAWQTLKAFIMGQKA
jgi:cytochrome c5